MASVAPIKSKLPRSRLLFIYHSAPVWLFGFGWVIFDRAKNAVLSEPGHFPQQGAGEQHETIPFRSLGTTTVISSVPHSELVRRGCHGHPVAGFPLSSALILNNQSTADTFLCHSLGSALEHFPLTFLHSWCVRDMARLLLLSAFSPRHLVSCLPFSVGIGNM